MNETNEGDISTKLNIKGRRKSILNKNVKINEDLSSKMNIKSRRKSMMNKKLLFQLGENKINKDVINSTSKRNSIFTNSITDLKLKLNENKNNANNNKPNRRRKSAMFAPIYELSSFLTLKAQLLDISELIVQQESDIVEAVIGCQQPNNYHIYGRQPDGELSYLYKLREYSGCAMRILCPVNCRGFNMKMKLVTSYENKYDNNFTNSLMQLEKNFKIPFLCLIRPDIKVNLIKEETYIGTVEQSFTCCDPSFLVYNEKNEKVKYIEADCCQCGFICRNTSLGKTDDVHFLIYDQEDKSKPIGDICKKTESVFSIADSYSVIYPVKIPPEEKILLSFVAVLIDYQYFEKNNVK
jgi:hypothetical protein